MPDACLRSAPPRARSRRTPRPAAAFAALLLAGAIPAQGAQDAAVAAPDPAADARALAATLGAFGARLHLALAGDGAGGADAADANLATSPTSAAMAVLLAYAGARGETADEIAAALAPAGWSAERVHAAAQVLAGRLQRAEPGFRLACAQDLWAQQGYELRPGYVRTLRDRYASTPHAVDFRSDAAGAIERINATIAGHTAGRIPHLLQPGDVDATTRLVLTNALYLKARWAREFDPESTSDRPFTLFSGRAPKVPTMVLHAELQAHAGEQLQVVRLPYVGGDYALDLALPTSARDAAAVDAAVAALLAPPRAGVEDWRAGLAAEDLVLVLPRFRASNRLSLGDALRRLGIRRAFTRDADFGGATPDPEGLQLADAIQQVWIDVAEKGTEAAAATAMIMVGAAASPRPPRVVAFDRPFAFALRDLQTGLVLFAGRCSDPRAR